MRTVLLILLSVFMFSVVTAQQPYNQVSATASQHSDGQWYLVLTGDSAEIARICVYGDCSRGSASLIDALNYWYTILGASKGIQIAPIPQPVQASAGQIVSHAPDANSTPMQVHTAVARDNLAYMFNHSYSVEAI